MDKKYQGPYSTTSELYSALSHLHELHARADPEFKDPDQAGAMYKKYAKIAKRLGLDEFEYEKGPFVPLHTDWSVSNVLVHPHDLPAAAKCDLHLVSP
jgi:hypothetical protein